MGPTMERSMGAYRYAIWIAASPERVYGLYTDLDRVADVSGDPSRAGATYTVRRGRSAVRSEVIVAERPTRHVVRMDGLLGLRAEIFSQFAPEGQGTRLTIGLDARGGSPCSGASWRWRSSILAPPGV